MSLLNVNKRLINFRSKDNFLTCSPKIMGIVNLSPESFHTSCEPDEKAIIEYVRSMIEQGADIIDIGACSTKPNHDYIDPETEWARLAVALPIIRKNFPNAIISLDTFRADIADKAVRQFGIDIINDISGGTLDGDMFGIAGQLGTPYILTHYATKEIATESDEDFLALVIDYFQKRIYSLKQCGVKDIILDPGFGFGKSLQQNYCLLRHLSDLEIFGLPILVGVSNKSMIYKALQCNSQQALSGSLAAEMFALEQGASILRVHDIALTADMIKIFNYIHQITL